MRETWRRDAPAAEIPHDAIRALLARLLPGAELRAAVALDGGLANANLRLDLAGPPGAAVLRIWRRKPQSAPLELAILRLVAGRVPAPAVLAADLAAPELDAPCALLSWIDGQRLQDLAGADDAALGAAIGTTLAAIHAQRFPGQGFLSAALSVATPLAPGGDGLLPFLRRCLVDGPGAARLGQAQTEELLDFAARNAAVLDHPWACQPCLSHGDFNPSNLLLTQQDGTWRMAAVLDWEFALAGGPAFDFAHVLRPPWGDRPAFLAGVARAYGADLPANWADIARIADLYAWADFLARPRLDETVARSARQMLARIMAG